MKLTESVVLIKGGGEVASGVAHRLFRSRFRVCLTEISNPTAVTRGVTFAEAVYDGEKEIEGVVAELVESPGDIAGVWDRDRLPIIIDPEVRTKDTLHPDILIDAIMAKKNLGTKITDAPLVIGLGPGFRAGEDVHIVIETNDSEALGRVISEGEAEKNTGVPIPVTGLTFERVVHAPGSGLFLADRDIGDMVTAGETIGKVGGQPVEAPVDGVIRALIRSGIQVEKGIKLLEIDPTGNIEYCYSIRAKMRAIAGGVLEAILNRFNV